MDPSSGFGCWSGREWLHLNAAAANHEDGWNESAAAVPGGSRFRHLSCKLPSGHCIPRKSNGFKGEEARAARYTSAASALWKYVVHGWAHGCGVVPQVKLLLSNASTSRTFQVWMDISRVACWSTRSCCHTRVHSWACRHSVSPRGIAGLWKASSNPSMLHRDLITGSRGHMLTLDKGKGNAAKIERGCWIKTLKNPLQVLVSHRCQGPWVNGKILVKKNQESNVIETSCQDFPGGKCETMN